ncbi:MAG TPA: U-box domain-containing protein [Gammaproteobacteria bacterium]|jgi:hypothetical protein|nr:U-box domain-containing protein [Gammaproteobacteria bacterium]
MQRTVTRDEFLTAIQSGDEDTVRAYVAMPERDNEVVNQGLRLAIMREDPTILTIMFNQDPSLLIRNIGADPSNEHNREHTPSAYNVAPLLNAFRRYDEEDDNHERYLRNLTLPGPATMLGFHFEIEDSDRHVPNVSITSYLRNLRNDDLSGSAPRFFAAARTNDREAIDSYIHDNHHTPGFSVQLRTAAQIAESQGHDVLAAYLSQLASDHDVDEAASTASSGSNKIEYNSNETRLMSVKFTGEIPNEICCPVTGVILFDPVTVSSGVTYEREALVKLMGSDTYCNCPCTRQKIFHPELNNASNKCILTYIENFIRQQENAEHVWDISAILTCPLSGKLFDDPVTMACGITFDRRALKDLFSKHNDPAEISWQDTDKITHQIKFNEVRLIQSDVAIKSLLESHLAKLKEEEQVAGGQLQADAVSTSPIMSTDQVRKARLRVFDRHQTDKNQEDKNDGWLLPPKKK